MSLSNQEVVIRWTDELIEKLRIAERRIAQLERVVEAAERYANAFLRGKDNELTRALAALEQKQIP